MTRIISHCLVALCVIFLLNGCFFFTEDQRWELEPQGSSSIALSRDGRFALLYSPNTELVLWDLEQNQLLAQLGSQDPQHSPVSIIRFSDNGRYALTAGQSTFAIWDLAWAQAKGLWSISDGIILDADLSSDGQQALLGLSNGKALWIDFTTGRRLELLAHNDKVTTVALSPNARYALTGGQDKNSYFWDTETGQILHQFTHQQRVNRVALHRDGKWAFTSDSGNQATIWNLQTGQPFSVLSSYNRQLIFSSARFSDDGSLLITGSPSGRVRVWNSRNGQLLTYFDAEPKKNTHPPRAVIYDATLDHQQRVVAATSAGLIQAWIFND